MFKKKYLGRKLNYQNNTVSLKDSRAIAPAGGISSPNTVITWFRDGLDMVPNISHSIDIFL